MTGRRVIFFSFIVAFLLAALPMPDWANNWRPVWVVMVTIYWCMALPIRIGMGIAWWVGLFLDVLQGVLLGQNALGLTLVAYIVTQMHRRCRMLPPTQQAYLVGFIVIFYLLISAWVLGITGLPPKSWAYWAPAISSALLWPWLFIVLRGLRRKYNVS